MRLLLLRWAAALIGLVSVVLMVLPQPASAVGTLWKDPNSDPSCVHSPGAAFGRQYCTGFMSAEALHAKPGVPGNDIVWPNNWNYCDSWGNCGSWVYPPQVDNNQ